jgi:putative ABC transport system permease protein
VAQFLIAAAFTFWASFTAAGNVALGFDAGKDILTVMLVPTRDSAHVDWADLAQHVATIPGVRRATYAGTAPLELSGMDSVKANLPGASESASKSVSFDIVGPDYFGVFGMRILAGRDFGRQDLAASSRVAATDEAAARLFWPNTPLNDVVGKWIRTDGVDLQIMAVVENAKYGGIYETSHPHLFGPVEQTKGEMNLVVKASGGSAAELAGAVRDHLRRAYPDVELASESTMKENVLRAKGVELAGVVLFGILGALAIALACVGLYGNATYLASYRTKELAVRMALGADRRNVLGLSVRQSARVAVPGIAVGISAAYALVRVASHATPAVSASWITFVISPVATGLIAMFAMLLPAYRASGTDPMSVLRSE